MNGPSSDDAAFMARFDGLYVGMLDADELETFADLVRRGLLRRSYSHAGGLLGLAVIECVPVSPPPSPSPDQHERPKP